MVTVPGVVCHIRPVYERQKGEPLPSVTTGVTAGFTGLCTSRISPRFNLPQSIVDERDFVVAQAGSLPFSLAWRLRLFEAEGLVRG